MISECGLEVERLAKELEESREKSSQLEGKLKVIEDAHSLEVARFKSWIGELERDLGKTASFFLKAKEAKTAKSSELRRLKRSKAERNHRLVRLERPRRPCMPSSISACRGYLVSLIPWRSFTLEIWPWHESRKGRTRSVKRLSLHESKGPCFPFVGESW